MDPLASVKAAYVTAEELMALFQEYTNPRDLMARLVKKGKLIRLKNGFFLLAEKTVPYEQIANRLYAPSYLSFDSALFYYQMLPEKGEGVTSACLGRIKHFKTPVGLFDYIPLSRMRYEMGVVQKENEAGLFSIATPEKALADFVHYRCGQLSSRALLEELLEKRGMHREGLTGLNALHLSEIAESYHAPVVRHLVKALSLLSAK